MKPNSGQAPKTIQKVASDLFVYEFFKTSKTRGWPFFHGKLLKIGWVSCLQARISTRSAKEFGASRETSKNPPKTTKKPKQSTSKA